LSLGLALAACDRADEVATLEVRPVAQTAGGRDPLYLARCRGGSKTAHYKWTLAAGLKAVPSLVDAPTLLVQSKQHAGMLDIKCTIEQEGTKPRTLSGAVTP
jgi:hypothetical protein